MLVFQILKEKSDDAVVTVPPGSTVADAAEILSSRRIGAIIVSKDGEIPQGILSERDIVRELGKIGPDILAKPVETLMTSNLITCTREETAIDVLEKMTDGRFRHMPVVEDGRMVGLISIGDVVKARLAELSMEKDALEDMITGH
jgi:CBS domain-containing protein